MNRREAIAALMSLPATAVVSEAKVQRNDVIVIECDEYLSLDMKGRIQSYAQQIWPDQKVIVFDKGMRLRIAKGE